MNNYVERNIISKQKLIETYRDIYKDMSDDRIWHLLRTWQRSIDLADKLLKNKASCVGCGGKFTGANLNFFDYDITKVQCYNCKHNLVFI